MCRSGRSAGTQGSEHPRNSGISRDPSQLTSAAKLDVDVSSPDVQAKLNALIAASCQAPGACDRERQVARNERRLKASPLGGFWLVGLAGFVAGILGFRIARRLGASARRAATALSLILVVGMAGVTAYVFWLGKDLHDGFTLLGLGMIWFGALLMAVPALIGVWVAVMTAREEDLHPES